jgi:hypothetical protein
VQLLKYHAVELATKLVQTQCAIAAFAALRNCCLLVLCTPLQRALQLFVHVDTVATATAAVITAIATAATATLLSAGMQPVSVLVMLLL